MSESNGSTKTRRGRKPTLILPSEEITPKPELVVNTDGQKIAEPDRELVDKAAMPFSEMGRAYLKQNLEKLVEAEPVARDGTDPEGVHDLRVATRRLRASLQVLEDTIYERKFAAKMRQELKALANSAGAVRDADVFLIHLNEYAEKQQPEEAEGLKVLQEEVEKRREKGRKKLLAALDSKKVRRTIKKLEKFVNSPGAGVRVLSKDANEMPPVLVRHFAGSTIWQRYEEVLAYETVMPAPIPILHRLRVACKRLRYTINLFEDALPEEGQKIAKQLSDVQDYLGELHDHQVGVDLATGLLADAPENLALQRYCATRESDIMRMVQGFQVEWENLSGPDFRLRMAKTLAETGHR